MPASGVAGPAGGGELWVGSVGGQDLTDAIIARARVDASFREAAQAMFLDDDLRAGEDRPDLEPLRRFFRDGSPPGN